jgi:hypothetical protein
MPEPHPGTELHQPGRRRPGPDRDLQLARSPPHQQRVTGRIGRRQRHQPPRLLRQTLELPTEAVLDPARQ